MVRAEWIGLWCLLISEPILSLQSPFAEGTNRYSFMVFTGDMVAMESVDLTTGRVCSLTGSFLPSSLLLTSGKQHRDTFRTWSTALQWELAQWPTQFWMTSPQGSRTGDVRLCRCWAQIELGIVLARASLIRTQPLKNLSNEL